MGHFDAEKVKNLTKNGVIIYSEGTRKKGASKCHTNQNILADIQVVQI